jgi:GcrA cell cycle regulator
MDEQTSPEDLSLPLPEHTAGLMTSSPEIKPVLETLVPAPAKKTFVTTMMLSNQTCKWPFGDPSTPDFHYCGRAPQSGRPYCRTHEAVSRPPMQRRR